jgi:hypothetical protein
MYLQNIGTYLQVHTALLPRRPTLISHHKSLDIAGHHKKTLAVTYVRGVFCNECDRQVKMPAELHSLAPEHYAINTHCGRAIEFQCRMEMNG